MNQSPSVDEILKSLAPDPASLQPAIELTEVPFRDVDGVMKILRNGVVVPLDERMPSQEADEVDVTATTVPVGQRLSVAPHVEAIMSEVTVTLSHDLQRRLRNVLISRLRGVRDQIELEDILRRPLEQGGLAFTDQVTKQLLAAVARHELELHGGTPSSALEPVVIEQHEAISAVPLLLADEHTLPAPAMPIDKPVVPSSAVRSTKPVMADVKFVPQLMGPVEELAAFTIIDFRRLSPDPSQATKRIFEKIQLLEQESFAKKIAGIKAWKRSEVYRVYVAMGQESMAQSKSITEVIRARQQAHHPHLSWEEFEAITELSSRLRQYHY